MSLNLSLYSIKMTRHHYDILLMIKIRICLSKGFFKKDKCSSKLIRMFIFISGKELMLITTHNGFNNKNISLESASDTRLGNAMEDFFMQIFTFFISSFHLLSKYIKSTNNSMFQQSILKMSASTHRIRRKKW